MSKKSFFTILILNLIFFVSCSSKPDAAECGKYYRHLVTLQQAGHKGILAALKSSEGKNSVIRYCMSLRKKQVTCAEKADNLNDAAACESEENDSFLDSIF